MLKKLIPILFLFSATSAFLSCIYIKSTYTPDELKLFLYKRVPAEFADRIVIPFEIDAEIESISREATVGSFTRREKMWGLLFTILSKKDIDLQYDEYKTYTAIDTYRSGRGNCLSFTNLIVGMARSIGVEAFFVEVFKEGKYDLIEGLVVNQRHVCAGYDVGGKIELVDFTADPKKHFSYRRLNDIDAIAHYYNNRGYDFLKENVLEVAEENFQMAVYVSPSFSWAYNNLAVAQSRRKDFHNAIINYEKAIEIDPAYEAPYGNLANLYFNLGETKKSEQLMNLLDKIKSKNPYQHIARALMMKEQQEYEQALQEMKKAVSLDRKNIRARIEIAKIYIEAGKPQKALPHLRTVLKLNPDHEEAKELLASIDDTL